MRALYLSIWGALGLGQVNQALLYGPYDQVGGAVDAQFRHQVGTVHGNRIFAQLEKAGNSLIRLARVSSPG
jgi:hypothetical protein